jgi:hypothetical protein
MAADQLYPQITATGPTVKRDMVWQELLDFGESGATTMVVYLTPELRGAGRALALPALVQAPPRAPASRLPEGLEDSARGCRLRRDLRHDFRRIIPERVAMTITRHKMRAVFDRYHIVSPANLQEATRKLAEPDSTTLSVIARPVTPMRRKRKAEAAQV